MPTSSLEALGPTLVSAEPAEMSAPASPSAWQDARPTTGARRLISYGEAIREATVQEMDRDSRVIVMGQGVDDFRGFYGTTLGLAERFGRQRVFDLPLSEEGTMGIAIGAAVAGLRPIAVGRKERSIRRACTR
jgi:transketolase C-terminal domain/subunit